MSHIKAYNVDVSFMAENVLIITTVFYNSGSYPKCEYFVVFPGVDIPGIEKSIGFNKRSFEEAEIELTEEFMHEEALNQAMIEVRNEVNTSRMKSGIHYTYSEPVEIKDVKRHLLHHWVRGHVTQSLIEIGDKSMCEELSILVYSLARVKPVETKKL